MRGADVEVEDEDEAGAAVVARVVVGDDGGDLKGATPSTTMNAMGESASAASTSDGDDETTVVGARLERCVREILRAMGEDVTREGLLDTPARVAKALTFAMRGYGTSATAALGTALFTKTDSSGLCEPKRWRVERTIWCSCETYRCLARAPRLSCRFTALFTWVSFLTEG